MDRQYIEKCIYCYGDVTYSGMEENVKCPCCGKSFAVMRFQSERAKLDAALAEGERARSALAEAEAEREAAQRRLNAAVAALDEIGASQEKAEARLDSLFEQTRADQQTRRAIEDLLRGLKTDQDAG